MRHQIYVTTLESPLVLTSDVTIYWDPEDGNITYSGRYGVPGSTRAAIAAGKGQAFTTVGTKGAFEYGQT